MLKDKMPKNKQHNIYSTTFMPDFWAGYWDIFDSRILTGRVSENHYDIDMGGIYDDYRSVGADMTAAIQKVRTGLLR
jgi:hypothetical protein